MYLVWAHGRLYSFAASPVWAAFNQRLLACNGFSQAWHATDDLDEACDSECNSFSVEVMNVTWPCLLGPIVYRPRCKGRSLVAQTIRLASARDEAGCL